MVFWILVLQCYWNNGPKKKNKMRQFWVKKTEGKQNSVTIMISADGKGAHFPVNLQLEQESF